MAYSKEIQSVLFAIDGVPSGVEGEHACKWSKEFQYSTETSHLMLLHVES